ncbi:MAG: UDP-N-acetylglucosamine 2-epimerase (non-hydrolyzing) [Limnochordaceae bacterium]|nr:UDP-N-acetylglucosamine 2-epimerase (non-hydrolyzing) [Limnochordaceae bacterium]
MGAVVVMPIFGTRPEAIKLAPVIKALEADGSFDVRPVVTGQHREILDQVLEVFGLEPVADLDIMVARQSLSHVTSATLTGLDPVFDRHRPQVVLVQGDTTTTFAASLAAFYRRIPVGHVEAGLRSDDPYHPFPEEINRRLTSVVASWHYAPTPRAGRRLAAEGVEAGRIWVTGNTVIDALLEIARRDLPIAQPGVREHLQAGRRLLLVTAHRRESWGEPHRSVFRALKRLVGMFEDVAVVVSVHPNPAVRSVAWEELGGAERVVLLEPPAYVQWVPLLKAAYLVLTDSGGIQEEAPALGKPVLVLREVTERPEGVEAGCARLVGTEADRIVGVASELLSDRAAYEAMAHVANPYGDGRASKRIVQALKKALALDDGEVEPFGATPGAGEGGRGDCKQ